MEQPLPLIWRKALAGLAIVALTVFILRQVGPILTTIMDVIGPFLLALILAYMFYPIVKFVQRRLKLGRVMGILVLAGLVVLVLLGLVLWLIPILYHQLIDAMRKLRTWLSVQVDRYGAAYFDEPTRNAMKESLSGDFGDLDWLIKRFAGEVETPGASVAQGSVAAVKKVAGGVAISVASIAGLAATIGMIAVIVFYLLIDFDRVPAVLRKLLPEQHREKLWDVMLKADSAVGGFLRGQLIVCMINGALMAGVLMIIGMKHYAILIGFFAGLLNFIPYLGPLAGVIPGILWISFSNQYQSWSSRGIWMGVLILGNMAIQANEGFVLQPFIVGRNASMHPLLVLTALVVGSQGGIGGMIVAVPIAAVVKVFWVELFWKDRA